MNDESGFGSHLSLSIAESENPTQPINKAVVERPSPPQQQTPQHPSVQSSQANLELFKKSV